LSEAQFAAFVEVLRLILLLVLAASLALNPRVKVFLCLDRSESRASETGLKAGDRPGVIRFAKAILALAAFSSFLALGRAAQHPATGVAAIVTITFNAAMILIPVFLINDLNMRRRRARWATILYLLVGIFDAAGAVYFDIVPGGIATERRADPDVISLIAHMEIFKTIILSGLVLSLGLSPRVRSFLSEGAKDLRLADAESPGDASGG
jgi:hypothetical protein